jgi:hypothetical protein
MMVGQNFNRPRQAAALGSIDRLVVCSAVAEENRSIRLFPLKAKGTETQKLEPRTMQRLMCLASAGDVVSIDRLLTGERWLPE